MWQLVVHYLTFANLVMENSHKYWKSHRFFDVLRSYLNGLVLAKVIMTATHTQNTVFPLVMISGAKTKFWEGASFINIKIPIFMSISQIRKIWSFLWQCINYVMENIIIWYSNENISTTNMTFVMWNIRRFQKEGGTKIRGVPYLEEIRYVFNRKGRQIHWKNVFGICCWAYFLMCNM